jgi:predicted transcriptional regulator
VAQKAWGLKPQGSAVIILDKDGTVLYFKDGKMTQDEIGKAVILIKTKLDMKM